MRDFRRKIFGGLSILGCIGTLLLASLSVRAQVSGYSFASSTTTYTPITGGTQLNASIPDSWVSGAIALSPAFNFGGISYTTAYVTSNGLLTLGGSAPSSSEYNGISYSSATGSGIAICPFNSDMNGSTAAGAAPEIRFETVGNEHVFQWKDAQRYNQGDKLSIQLRLNTATGVITMVYGGGIIVGTGTSYQPIVGIRTSTTDYKNLKVTGPGAETWAAPLIGTSTGDNLRFTAAAPLKAATDGQTYTFTPNCLRPVSVTIAGSTSTSTTTNLNWAAPAGGSPMTYLWEVRTSGAAGSGATGLVASGTTTAPTTTALVSGLTLGTSYSAYVRAICGGTDSSTWTAAVAFTHQLPCVAPTAQPTALTLTPASTSVSGSFTAASPAADRYLVVRTTGAAPTAPVDGTTYSTGAGLGGNIVAILTSPTVTFSSTGLTGNTSYAYYVYAYNTACFGGPIYNTTNPLTATTVTCPAAPGSLTSSAVTATGFTLTWTSAAGGGVSTTINHIVEVATDAAFVNQIAGSPFTIASPTVTTNITGLSAATQYFYRVRTVGTCSSSFTNGSVSTPCGGAVFSSFPYVQGFDGGAMPPCWTTALISSSGTAVWAPIVGASGDIAAPAWGNGFIEKNWPASTADLYSPAFNLSSFGSTQARINMWVHRHASALANDSIIFSINTSASSTGATQLMVIKPLITAAPAVPATGWYNYTANIPTSFNTSTPVYIVVRGVTTSASVSYDQGIDSFRLEQVPTCFLPTGVAVSPTSNGGALSWTAPTTGAPTAYQYEVRTSGAPGSGSPAATGIVTAPALTATLNTLAFSTTYTVYVRSICGPGDSSLWTLPTTFTTLSNCVQPTAVTATASSSTSIVLNWTASVTSPISGYQYEVRTSGAAGSGATGLAASGSTAAGINTATASTGLAPSTSYTVYVRTNCGSGNFSVWTTGVTVATPCNSVATFPYTEGFESGTLPACWSTAVVSGTANWSNVVSSSTDISAPFAGTGFIRKPYNTSTANLYSAPFNLSGFGTTQARINVWVYRHASTVANDSIQFSINTSASATGATPLMTIKPLTTQAPAVPASGWYNYTANIPVSFNTTTPAYIVIRGVTTAGSSSYDLGLDSFRLEQVPTCFPPTGVAIAGTTPTGTTINWTAPTTTTPTSYTYEVRTAGAPGSGSTGLVTTGTVLAPLNIAAVNALTPGTTYRVYVRSNCGSNDSSTWTFPAVQFTTPASCSVPTALTATGITTTSANLGWTVGTFGGATSWQISYGLTGTTAANGTKVTVTANPYMLSNLTPATGYVFFVRAICAPGDTSAWSSSRAFNSICNPSTLPFAENFATIPPNVCWSMATGFLTTTATALTPAASTSWGSDQYLNNSANGPAARINLYTTGKRDWLISPTIDLGATPGNYVLEFNLGVVAYSSSTTVTSPAGVALGSDDTVAVVVSTNNGATWTRANALGIWTAANTPISATGTQRYYIPMNGYSGQIKIGFYGGEGTVADAPDNDIFIDSVRMVTCTVPSFSLGNDTVLCSGASATLSASTGATGYTWSTGATTQSITVSAAGTYSVLAYNNSLGCAKRDTVVVTTGTNPTVNLGPDTTFCSGPAFTLNAGNAGSTFLYNTGATTQSLPVTTSGQYSVRVRNAAGCFGRDTVNVTINPTPVVNLGNDTTVCGNVQSFILNAGNPGATFTWMGNLSTGPTLNIAAAINALNNGPIVSGGATYTSAVTVTSPAGCVAADTIRVTVTFSPRVADYVITGQDPMLTFTPVGDSAATSYAWSFGDGGTASTRIATRTFANNGVYNVRLIVSNTCGSDTVLKQVQVNTTGVSEVISGSAITLYPNPTTADAVLEVEGGATLRSYQVVSATGALVMSEPASGPRATIRTANLAAGIYSLRIQLDKGVVVRKLEVIR